ncbi:hypothetical protein [Desulfitobacterium metallireducens]|uniref:ParB/Sulfiredoxin domain-containing protein n=1 Tax=Desulfitobacterium metallireducens DSM 15288 TaxID=871968 RepID=W0EHA8_9FIRM|nr:hypothetical protein [Desulfitobacterium metallireducens]AHF08456.1 hypothetical protein DESME_03440 [Desulfitobacterium metallireducens DSM 15288]
MEHIITGKLDAEKELVNIPEWFEMHNYNVVNEDHLPSADITKPVIQAEIRPGIFQIIDGNHRVEKAYRDKVDYIKSYKLKGEQLIAYFIDVRGCKAFIEYWNSKL